MSNKLFIIGNGFDLAHSLKTSYDDFHQFLKNKYISIKTSNGIPILPMKIETHREEPYYEKEEVTKFFVDLISDLEGEEWQTVEETLGFLSYDELLSEASSCANTDEDGEPNPWHRANLCEDISSVIKEVSETFIPLFEEWIYTIYIPSASKKENIEKLLNASDFFLTFNYTRTLEKLYNVKNVCHIHGTTNREFFFGHGTDKTFEDFSYYIGSEDNLLESHNSLKKDTTKALENNREFFKKISSDITKIYSFGFSFGDVDLIYIKEICKRLSKDTTWYLNTFYSHLHNDFKKKIVDCGFKGKFGTYTV